MGRVRSLLSACFTSSSAAQPTTPYTQRADWPDTKARCAAAAVRWHGEEEAPSTSSASYSVRGELKCPPQIERLVTSELSYGPAADDRPAALPEAPVDIFVDKPAPSSIGSVLVQSLGAGMVDNGPFLDGDDKPFSNFLASGGLSPFQSSASVPFGFRDPPDEVVAVISNATTQIATLNLTADDTSPSIPLDLTASGNGTPFSQFNLTTRGRDPSSSSDVLRKHISSGRANMQRMRFGSNNCTPNYQRQCSAVAQAVALPPSTSMAGLSKRLSLPVITGPKSQPQLEGSSPGSGATCGRALGTRAQEGGARIESRMDSLCTAVASSFSLNTARCVSGTCAPLGCSSVGGSVDTLCDVNRRNGHGGGGGSGLTTAAVGDSCYSGCSGGSVHSGALLEPQITLAIPHSVQQDGSGAMARNTPTLLAFPSLGGLCSRDTSPPLAQQLHPDSFLSTTGPSPADNFLRFTDLDTCWAEMRDLSFIGSGAGGHVYSGTWCGMPVAVKFMLSGDANQLQRQQREAALSRLASHPHLVQTYAVAAAQLTPALFLHDPQHPRASGLSHTDLLATYAAAGSTATAVDLYGTTSVSPSPSLRVARQSFTAAGAAGGGLASSGPSAADGGVPTGQNAGGSAARGYASGAYAGGSPFGALAGQRVSMDVGVAAAIAARQAGQAHGAGSDPLHPAFGTLSPAPSLRGSASRMHHMQQQLRAGASVSTIKPSGSSCGGGASASENVQGQARGPLSSPMPHLLQPAGPSAERGGTVGAKSPALNHTPLGAAGASWRERKSRMQVSEAGFAQSLTTAVISTVDMDNELQVEGKADSFVMAHSEQDDGLMLFQPADVLAHIGARPAQWLTVVIMEEMDRGSLHRAIHGGIFHPTNSHLHKRHRVRAIVRTLLEVAQGMAHLHSAGLVHGDLKPANVLLKAHSRDQRGFVAKVSDFGVTRAMAEGANQATVSTSDWGTVIYTAPEVFNGKSGPASDVFSFGVLTWHLTTGQLPHEDINPFAVMLAVSRGELELEWPSSVPRPLRKLGKLCMQFEAASRPTFAEIARALLKLENKMRLCGTGSTPPSAASTGNTAGGLTPAAVAAAAAAAAHGRGGNGRGGRP